MIRFLYPPSKQEKTKQARCIGCGFYFTINSYKFYCCDKTKAVCTKCQDHPCNSCGKARNKRLNLACFKCQRSYDESDMFFDFLADKAYCSKCLSYIYLNEYDQRYNHPVEVSQKAVRLYAGKEYPYEDLVNYFRLLCICCGQSCKDKQGFQLAKNARICQNCIQSRLQLMSKMLKCVECEGYIHSSSEIIYCVYCQKKNADQFKKYEPKPRESTQRAGGAIFSAVDMSQLRESNLSMESKGSEKEGEINIGTKKIKIHYRNSAVDDIENVAIEIRAKDKLATCFLCCALYIQEAMVQFQDPMKKNSPTSELICRICYLDLSFLQSPKKYVNEKLSPIKLMQSPKQNPIIKKSVATPNKQVESTSKTNSSLVQKYDIFNCVKCRNKYGSIKTQAGYFCTTCHYQNII